MILPIRCFTCNRLIADEKVLFYEKNKYKSIEQLEEMEKKAIETAKRQGIADTCELVLYPIGLKKEYRVMSEKKKVSPSPEFFLLNLMGVNQICCRRMFLGNVNLIEKIS
jgi:DNA-directed RNA polymerase subunit N (RpoN/RPB10)